MCPVCVNPLRDTDSDTLCSLELEKLSVDVRDMETDASAVGDVELADVCELERLTGADSDGE